MTTVAPESPEGKIFGWYRLEAKIGEGGMGEVYLAVDTRLGRRVALKVLPSEFTRDPDRLSRFRQEARTASALNHPNILTIHDVGEVNATHFIAAEFVEGVTLRRRMEFTDLDLTEILRIIGQVASALGAAHAAGVVHRDIKPENIMIRSDGYVKVLDFGLAKLLESSKDSDDSPTDVKTNAGIVMGTGHYMSPEQARGENVDARTDIWSLGVVLYEMVARRRPFEAPTLNEVIANVLYREPPPLKAPSAIARIIEKSLSKDRQRRYQSIAELQADLKQLAGETSKPRRLSRIWIAAAIAAVIAIGGIAAWKMRPGEPKIAAPAPVAIKSVAVLPFANLSGSADNDYLSDSMSEEIMNALARLPGLKVVSRTSSFAFKGQHIDVRDVGRKLGVASVVEGSIQKSGNRLRVSAKLVGVADGYNLWSDRFDREMTDVFAMQDDIATAVASALRARLTGVSQLVRPPTSDLEAYALYIKARDAASIWSRERFDRAIVYYRAALDRDPRFAQAWAGLADLYSAMDHRPGLTSLKPSESYRLATDAANRALALDPQLAEAHAAMGHIQTHLGDFAGAEQHLKRAVELNPNSGMARIWYANLLRTLHRPAEARPQYLKAREVDPFSVLIAQLSASTLWKMGDFEDAASAALRGIEIAPDIGELYLYLARSHASLGKFREAERELGRAEAAAEQAPFNEETRALVLALENRKKDAADLLSRIEREKSPPVPLGMIEAYAALGDNDRAAIWLDRWVTSNPEYARVTLDLPQHPAFAAFRADSRYLNARKRLGLPVD